MKTKDIHGSTPSVLVKDFKGIKPVSEKNKTLASNQILWLWKQSVSMILIGIFSIDINEWFLPRVTQDIHGNTPSLLVKDHKKGKKFIFVNNIIVNQFLRK